MNTEIADALAIVLDFVERHNAKDGGMVAEAANKIESWLATYQPEDKMI